jgi:hypothetical protein
VRQQAEHAEPVVDRHDHRRHALRAALGELPPFIVVARAVQQGTAMEPDDHGLALAARRGLPRRVDVEVEAIFCGAGRTGKHGQGRDLGARTGLAGCVAHAAPGLRRGRRTPAQFTHRRLGIGNPEESLGTVPGDATQGAVRRFHDRIGGRARGETAHRQSGCQQQHDHSLHGGFLFRWVSVRQPALWAHVPSLSPLFVLSPAHQCCQLLFSESRHSAR